jgi:hypothetical protein
MNMYPKGFSWSDLCSDKGSWMSFCWWLPSCEETACTLHWNADPCKQKGHDTGFADSLLWCVDAVGGLRWSAEGTRTAQSRQGLARPHPLLQQPAMSAVAFGGGGGGWCPGSGPGCARRATAATAHLPALAAGPGTALTGGLSGIQSAYVLPVSAP